MLRTIINFIRRTLTPNRQAVRYRPEDVHRVYDRPDEPEQPQFIPIESDYKLDRIPCTCIDIGSVAKVLQTIQGELITGLRRYGAKAGCGHILYSIERIVTSNWIKEGLGGFCGDCTLEAAAKYLQGQIPLEQAQMLSLYCTACQGHQCNGCGRRDLCTRHSLAFEQAAGGDVYLCPACMEKARQEKFFRKTLEIMLLPFSEDPPTRPANGRNPYEQQ